MSTSRFVKDVYMPRTKYSIKFVNLYDIDILLVSENHFTDRSHIKVPNYIIYHTLHPDATAHGGTTIIIRQNIKHHIREEYNIRTEYVKHAA
jgi:hypothetical protein